MNYTKGPWRADMTRANGHIGISIRSEDGIDVATVYLAEYQAPNRPGGEVNQPANTQARGNAGLVAASPALYEALQLAEATIMRLDKRGSALGTLDVIRSAISKAEEV